MMSYPVAVLALLGVAALADAVVVGSAVWFFGRVLNTRLYLLQLTKLEEAGNRKRAAMLSVAAGNTLIGLYSRYLYSLEIPRKTMGSASEGFRAAAPSIDFDEVVRENAQEYRRRLEQRVHVAGAGALVGGVVALAASVLVFQVYGRWPWEGTDDVDGVMKAAIGLGAAGVVVGGFSASHWPKTLEALRMVERTVLPWLVPVEEMSEDQRSAAQVARGDDPRMS